MYKHIQVSLTVVLVTVVILLEYVVYTEEHLQHTRGKEVLVYVLGYSVIQVGITACT